MVVIGHAWLNAETPAESQISGERTRSYGPGPPARTVPVRADLAIGSRFIPARCQRKRAGDRIESLKDLLLACSRIRGAG
jgi:hypothetical protein